ncbi:monovalent cation:proton antiporter-2 (CPA2) family protein [Terrimonas sp. NA20]|uniref:Monovalent cation:proton antiporter-2 (CPA2) family protein n=1 Tax=Terrimonas ginsenosidimutans TaxID=2908004 RepID=A0ABS9KYR1_9BACT|nr:monovalent cation:proton antiporter-2 (CPA2) family protein [Terrimonas ginsenosidimutans]MCG2617448.1 monovalent cation:proton antiporter-2 (CPA2) family protein [Terrimonas ginsenosidimutans]
MQQTFFFQAMIYLAAAVIMVPIAKRLGLGSVLGYLFAGIIIGPVGLHFIGEEGQDLMHFAEFGVVMLLFIIGLELEPSRLWRMRRSIAGLGGLQVGITTLVLAGAVMLLQLDWKQALVLGMILSLSSTAIVLQSLSEKNQLKTSAGESSFAVLLFQDLAVIPMLAILPLLAVSHSGATGGHKETGLLAEWPGWAQTLAVLGSVAVVIISGRYLLRPFFRLIAKTGLREIFTATALLLVVGTATLMNAVGLSPALGAFLAGVVLANSEYRHELESDLDPFKGLLLGLFFIAVGASINFHLILSRPWMILGLVGAVMIVKMAVLTGLGKLFKLATPQNLTFAFGLSQVGEFAFVLSNAARDAGILSTEIMDTLVAVVALSMVITPLVMLVNDKWIQPRLCDPDKHKPGREHDVEAEENPVIIAGFGHFGNTVGRFLRANNINTTVLDTDSDNVDLLRRMGFKVYYGDASRHELLEIAGAKQAKLIIIAIGDEEKRLEMIQTIKKHFPNLRMLVRATNRNDAYDLMNAGMMHIYRETLDTSLRMGVDAMKLLGYRAHETTRLAKTFFKEDERRLKYLSSIRNPDEYVIAVKKYVEELEETLRADRDILRAGVDDGWDGREMVKAQVELAEE